MAKITKKKSMPFGHNTIGSGGDSDTVAVCI